MLRPLQLMAAKIIEDEINKDIMQVRELVMVEKSVYSIQEDIMEISDQQYIAVLGRLCTTNRLFNL